MDTQKRKGRIEYVGFPSTGKANRQVTGPTLTNNRDGPSQEKGFYSDFAVGRAEATMGGTGYSPLHGKSKKLDFVSGPESTGLPIASVAATTPAVITTTTANMPLQTRSGIQPVPMSLAETQGMTGNYDLPLAEEIALVYPPEVLDPKVFAEYNPAPGKVPRKIHIERAKRKYASLDIDQLLRMVGIDYSIPPDENELCNYLDLETFDNTDFDDLKPIDWINLGKKKDIQARIEHEVYEKRMMSKKERNLKKREAKRKQKRHTQARINEDDEEDAVNDEDLSSSEEDELLAELRGLDEEIVGILNGEIDPSLIKQEKSPSLNQDDEEEESDENEDGDESDSDQITDPALLEGLVAQAQFEENDQPELMYAPRVEAPIPVPARAARFSEDGTARWEPCEVIALLRIRDESNKNEQNQFSQLISAVKPTQEIEEEHNSEQEENSIEDEEVNELEKYIVQKPEHHPIKAIKEVYEVQWGDTTTSVVSRINLMFLAEDPEKFAMRVLWAHQRRKEAELTLKYNLFIESMPTDDIELPSQRSLEKIMELSTLSNTSPLHHPTIAATTHTSNVGSFGTDEQTGMGTNEEYEDDDLDIFDRKRRPLERRQKLARMDTTPFLREVTHMHQKAMNKLIFDQMRREGDEQHAHMFEGVELPPLPQPPPVPEQATVPTPPHMLTLPQAKNELVKQSFMTKPQVIAALAHIRGECNKVIDNRLFCVGVLKGKTVRLDDFSGMQTQTCSSVVSYLNDRWMQSLKQGVVTALETIDKDSQSSNTVGKGWFNLEESNQDVYEVSKLKKFFNTVTFMMQDSLRTMMQKSVEEYVSFFENLTPVRVEVNGMDDVKLVFKIPHAKRGKMNMAIALKKKERDALIRRKMIEQYQNSGEDVPEELLVVEDDAEFDLTPIGDTELTVATLNKHYDIHHHSFQPTKTNQIIVKDLLPPPPPKPISLLTVELEWTVQEGVHSNVALEKLFNVPLQLFDTALESCQEFLHLETQLMPKLFKVKKDTQVDKAISNVLSTAGGEGKKDEDDEQGGTKEKTAKERRKQLPTNIYLLVLDSDDEFAKDRYNRLKNALTNSIEPLHMYVETFAPLHDILTIDPVKFATEQCGDESVSPSQIADLVRQYQQNAENVNVEIPNDMNLGVIMVNNVKLKALLKKKHLDISKALIQTLGKRVSQQATTLIEQYQALLSKLTDRPHTTEELVQKREFLKTIPKELENLNPELEAMKATYDTLEQFDYTFTDDEFKKHWAGYGWSQTIFNEVDETSNNLDRYQKMFEEQLVANQEKFARQLQDITIQVSRLSRHNEIAKVNDVFTEVSKINIQLDEMKKQLREFNTNEGLLGREVTEYPELATTAKKFEGYYLLWTTANNWSHWKVDWKESLWEDLDAPQMETQLQKAMGSMTRCTKLFREVPEPLSIAQTCKGQMEELAPRMPMIVALCNPGMKDRHWKSLEDVVGFDMRPKRSTTMQDMLDLDLGEHLDEVMKIADVAAKEYSLEESLIEMKKEWEDIIFEIKEYKNTKTYVMYGAAEIQEKLDMHLLRTQAMSFSPFKEPHKDAIEKWLSTLQRVSLVIEEWLKCQKRWIYLEPIFSSEDIQRQLPVEYKRFQGVDRTWRRLMNQAHAKPSVLQFCEPESLLSQYQEMFNVLESVANGLESYLETKRRAFPRFYFLSSDELLDILSQTKDPTRVQPYLSTCFEAIKSVTFQPDMEITAMTSKEREVVDFVEGIYPEGNVEQWLKEVETCMFTAVREQIVKSLADYKVTPRKVWANKWQGQVVIAVSQIYWTEEIERCIEEGGAKSVEESLKRQLSQLEDLTEIVRGPLTENQRVTIGALITMDVHARDVTKRLIENNIEKITDFDWISQFRYYWEEDDCHVKMMQTDVMYQYEYLGNTSRLVLTPLTDRLYMTLMGAINLHLGGAPAGPAGTGKTETTKDLAKAVAVKCVVFNCSESLKVNAMGKFFKGLAMTGAWSCFDEFNRIDIEVLSVIAQQIATIQNAIMDGVEHFIFEDDDIPLIPTLSIFITMNPGYAGRSELPDNLKALFRPVAVMIPDYALIAEIRLFSFGFKEGFALSKKMVATFKLSSEQLSSQDHYDFGMRAVNTVISAAGNLKHEFPNESEELLLLRALRDTNIPKFLAEDIPLFKGIVSDLFPGVEPMVVDYGKLQDALIETATKNGLQPREAFITKCLQLYETTVLRHGLMLVGPTGGGKSESLTTLSQAMTTLKKQGEEGYDVTILHKLNPKSIPYGDLYGTYDAATNDWKNGILTLLMRECVRDESTTRHWIVCDGPVDAVWIEDMNTVLDDSKKLCLASGEVIPLTPYMNMIFEVEDLKVASPATVSRCGMVYLEPSTTVPPTARVHHWLSSVKVNFSQYAEQLEELCNTYLGVSLDFVRRNCFEAVPTVDANLCMSFFNMMEAQFIPFMPNEAKGETAPSPESLEEFGEVLTSIFVFAIIWSIGATTNLEGRKAFNAFLISQIEENNPEWLAPSSDEDFGPIPAKGTISPFKLIPRCFTLYDFVYNLSTKRWIPWMDTVPEYVIKPKTQFTDMIVPTVDSVRNTKILDMIVQSHRHFLSIGSTGTGKTVAINQYLMGEAPSAYVPIPITFSAQTSAPSTQHMLDDKMERRRTGIVGAPPGSHFVIFVDDLNMPKPEIYGAQPPIELLRQFIDHGGWYIKKDSTTIPFFKIEDVQLIGAMGPPGGGRNPVTNRFLRHFNHLYFTDLEQSSEKTIFSTILSSFLSQFPDNVRGLTNPIVSATIEVYHTIMTELLPTPTKSHYTFNLRDLSKVFQGILTGDPKSLQETSQIIRLWIHETQRVFGDRLVTSTKDIKDRETFGKLLSDQLKKHFQVTWEGVGASNDMMFGDFLAPSSSEVKPYQQITDMEKLKHTLDEALDDYRDAGKGGNLELVMFNYAIQHIARISRVLRQPYGNALLLGVGGSGRQSLTRLAAHIADYTLKTVEIKKGFNRFEWYKSLKEIMKIAGMDAEPTVFLFSDTQLVQEAFLEDINNMLNAGDVPNIWDVNEMETIYTTMRPIAQSLGIIPTKINLFSHFVKRIRSNIHIVLCMSPFGDAFRNRLRMFPSLVTCCTIDWFDPWPDEALRAVAEVKLEETSFELIPFQPPILDDDETEGNSQAQADLLETLGTCEGADLTDKVIEGCVFIHQSVERANDRYLKELRRTNSVTPLSYLELLQTLKTLLKKKKEELKTLKNRLSQGVEKIQSATVEVAKNDAILKDMQPKLEKKSKDVEDMMKQIQKDQEDANEQRSIVKKEEEEASAQASKCQEMRDEATALLEKALPILRTAEKSLEKLNPQDIAEVAGYKAPAKAVVLVLAALCVVMGRPPDRVPDPDHPNQKKDDYLGPARQLVSKPNDLMNAMLNYDKEHLDSKMIAKIEPYVQNEDFVPEKVAKGSKACMSICIWIRALYNFHFTYLDVKPKQELVAKAEKELAIVRATLKEKQDSLNKLEANIRQLEEKFQSAVDEKEALTQQVQNCVTQRDRAFRLTGGLGGECTRWMKEMKDIELLEHNAVGDILISAGTVCYLGPFTSQFRTDLITEWKDFLKTKKIPYTKSANIQTTLADHVAVRQWGLDGLPTDNLSIENGLIMSNARRWPLMIDPQGQANKWIRNMEKGKLDIVKLTEDTFLRTLETAIRFGRPVLIESVGEELDPAIEPVLTRSTFMHKGTEMLKLGDTTLPYNNSFKLYMTTKLPNPRYAPETSVKVTLLNFTVTQTGLEDQLLANVVIAERPDLEEQKNSLMSSNAKMRAKLKELEDQILKMLSETLNPLEDESLVTTLSESKKMSTEIEIKVKEAEETEKQIDETRNTYKPMAVRGSILFFCVADLSAIDPMYQYSLQWFLGLYRQSIEDTEQAADFDTRLSMLIDNFTYLLYQNVCRSLFARHKLMFSFLMVCRILTYEGKIDPEEFRFLISNASTKKQKENPAPDWLTSRAWNDILALSELPTYENIDESVIEKPDEWKVIFDSSLAHREPLPDRFNDLKQFNKLLVLKCIRSDKITEGVQDFVQDNFGKKYVQPPNFNLAKSYRDSNNLRPLIFIISPGTNPVKDLDQFAIEMRMTKKLHSLSLGQGQGVKAEQIINEATENGGWVLLQNCDLYTSWMPELERIVENWKPENVHRDFRLWLTSQPSEKFPVSILQSGIKMTNEPPKGLQANLLRTYESYDPAFLQQAGEHDPSVMHMLLFSLSFFHGVIQERRKFGALGWNIRYDFTVDDLNVCIKQLRHNLETYTEVPYKVLSYLFGEINYGGRVTDFLDRRLIITILDTYICPGVLEEGYHFSPSGKYTSINFDDLKSYIAHIQGYDLNAHPEVFGLHENADITCAMKDTSDLFGNLLAIQPATGSGSSGKTREQIIEEKCKTFQEKIPPLFDYEEASRNFPTSYEESMNTVVVQEVIRYNKLLKVIHTSLEDMLNAMSGKVVMSQALEDMSSSLYNNLLPAMWAQPAYPSMKPLAVWVVDLADRCNFLTDWLTNGTPKAFWISGLFFPQAFLTGTLQNYARKTQIPIDKISFEALIIDNLKDHTEITEKAAEGCYIYGMYLEGARWDSHEHTLAESRPKELYTSFPIMHLNPVQDYVSPDEGVYNCPIYKILTRQGTLSTTGHSTNYVISLDIPSKDSQAHWIKRSVALFCALDY